MSTEDTLHTIIRNAHVLWAESFGRWFTSREALLAQGFPVTNDALSWSQQSAPEIKPLCSFNISRLQSNFASRSRVAMMHQAGNAMNVNVVGSVLLFAMIQVKEVASSSGAVVPRALKLCDDDKATYASRSSSSSASSRRSIIDVWAAWRSSGDRESTRSTTSFVASKSQNILCDSQE